LKDYSWGKFFPIWTHILHNISSPLDFQIGISGISFIAPPF